MILIHSGVVTLLNDVRLNQGLPTLGFLNPLLYMSLQGQGFLDVTQGENTYNSSICPGFKPDKGWDPASGWGSPDFAVLKELITIVG